MRAPGLQSGDWHLLGSTGLRDDPGAEAALVGGDGLFDAAKDFVPGWGCRDDEIAAGKLWTGKRAGEWERWKA